MDWYRKALHEDEGVPFSSLEGEIIKEIVSPSLCDGEVVFIMESGNEYCLTQIHDYWPDAREIVMEKSQPDLSGGVVTLAEERVRDIVKDPSSEWLGDKVFSYYIKTTEGDLVIKWFNEFDGSRTHPEYATLFKMPEQQEDEEDYESSITAKEAIELCEEHYIKGWSNVSENHPYNWEKYNLTVVGDAHLPSGKRIHVVKEDARWLPEELDNALVFSLQDI